MLKRIITAAWALAMFVPCMIFSDTWLYPALFSMCAALSVFEMTRCAGLHRNMWVCIPLYLTAAAAPLYIRLLYLNPTIDGRYGISAVLLAVLAVMLWLFGVTVFGKGKIDITLVGTVFLTFAYSTAGFSGAVYLHDFCGVFGKFFYLMCFIGAWMTDTFAYFTGRLFGKHKLIPEVSPKKTVEGAIGGIVFCVASFVGYALLTNALWLGEDMEALNPVVFGVVGLVTSVVSQIGDLAMSALKRHFGIKDYSQLLPGHGGILDRFDSVLAVSTLLTIACFVLNGRVL